MYAREDAKQLRKFIRCWQEIPWYQLRSVKSQLGDDDHRLGGDDVSMGACRMVSTYSSLELGGFLSNA